MTIARPLRHPDAASAHIMTKRGWWLVVCNVLLPGSAQVLAGNRRLGRVGIVATLLLWLARDRRPWSSTCSRRTALYTLVHPGGQPAGSCSSCSIAYAVLWVVLTLDTLRLVRLVKTSASARGWIAAFAVVVLVGITGTAGYASVVAGSARGALGDIFSAGPSQPPVDGRYNIMLLGGDAGPDRDGLRPDSMSVVSIDANTGQAVTIGLPRDLDPVPFPASSPLHALYPDGYGYDDRCDVDVCQLNSIYTEVSLYKPELYPNAKKQHSDPGHRGDAGCARGRDRADDPVLRAHRHAGLRRPDRRARRRRHHRHGAPPDRRRREPQRRRLVDRAGQAAHERLHAPSGTPARATGRATTTGWRASVSCRTRSSSRSTR